MPGSLVSAAAGAVVDVNQAVVIGAGHVRPARCRPVGPGRACWPAAAGLSARRSMRVSAASMRPGLSLPLDPADRVVAHHQGMHAATDPGAKSRKYRRHALAAGFGWSGSPAPASRPSRRVEAAQASHRGRRARMPMYRKAAKVVKPSGMVEQEPGLAPEPAALRARRVRRPDTSSFGKVSAGCSGGLEKSRSNWSSRATCRPGGTRAGYSTASTLSPSISATSRWVASSMSVPPASSPSCCAASSSVRSRTRASRTRRSAARPVPGCPATGPRS